MDVLTLPEPGWALAYPDPRFNDARIMHLPCGWRSAVTTDPEFWRLQLDDLAAEHRCLRWGGGR